MVGAEILVVIEGCGCGTSANGFLIMIADSNSIGNAFRKQRPAGTFNTIHRISGVAPLSDIRAARLDVTVLSDVPELSDIGNVSRDSIRNDPLGLRVKHFRHTAIQAGNVELCVRQSNKLEILGWVGIGRTAIELDRDVS